jgi:undecaprenyl diphosphate synthase
LAYSELYFTPVLWPDFDSKELDRAIEFFAGRERRFGMTSAQVAQS